MNVGMRGVEEKKKVVWVLSYVQGGIAKT